ncbi:MAG TPA: GNAT family N-acetyltransferase, partial [Candidatus Lokiarchaeia archaeon]
KDKISLKQESIRMFFLSFESSSKKNVPKDDLIDEIEKKGLTYIQMRLPVEGITPEYEKKLKDKIEPSIRQAKIREANEDDLKIVMTIYNRAWLTSNTPFSHIDLNSLNAIYEHPDTVILISRLYGMDGGFIILDYEGPKKEYGVIAGLGILPNYQRKGLGTVLGLAGWKYFKEKGVKELHCEVFVENKASYTFIKSLGFVEYGKKTYGANGFIIE